MKFLKAFLKLDEHKQPLELPGACFIYDSHNLFTPSSTRIKSAKAAVYRDTTKGKDILCTPTIYQIDDDTIGWNLVDSLNSLTDVNLTTISLIEIGGGVTCIDANTFTNNKSLDYVSIPDTVEYIDTRAFYGCNLIDKIDIPSSVTFIGDFTFFGCSAITDVKFNNGTEYIGMDAFASCPLLTKMKLPETLTGLGRYNFTGDNNITYLDMGQSLLSINDNGTFEGLLNITSIDIPDSVTYIGNNAFHDFNKAKYINIGNGVTYIGNAAFTNLSACEYLDLGESVETIAELAFTNCSLVTSIVFPDSTRNITCGSITGFNNVTYMKFGSGIIRIPNKIIPQNVTKVDISEGVLILGNNAYVNNNITEIILPDSLTLIEDYAIVGCKNLEKLHLGSNITYFYGTMYALCDMGYKSIKEVELNNGLLALGYGAFYNCTLLKNLEIPDSVSIIDDCLCQYCYSISSIKLPNNSNLTKLGSYMFSDCAALTYLEIPDSVVSANTLITSSNSYFPMNLSTIIIGLNLSDVNYLANGKIGLVTLDMSRNTSITSFLTGNIIQLNMTTIQNVLLPESLKVLGDRCFSGCTLIKDLQFGNSLEYVGFGALLNCQSLTRLIFPDNLTYINSGSLYNLSNVLYIKFGTNITYMPSGVVYNCPNLTGINLGNVTYLEGGIISSCASLRDIVFSDNLTVLKAGAFYELTSLTSINLNKVQCINSGSFIRCNLSSIIIPESVTFIDSGGFSNSMNVTSIIINSSNAYVPSGAFYAAPTYAHINLTYISSTIFDDTNLTVLELENTKYISVGAFLDNNNVTSIILPDTLDYIQNYAFYNYSNLKEIVIPDNVTTLEPNFDNSPSLTSMTIGKNLTQIDRILLGKENLQVFNFNGTEEEWNAIPKVEDWNLLEYAKFDEDDILVEPSTYLEISVNFLL